MKFLLLCSLLALASFVNAKPSDDEIKAKVIKEVQESKEMKDLKLEGKSLEAQQISIVEVEIKLLRDLLKKEIPNPDEQNDSFNVRAHAICIATDFGRIGEPRQSLCGPQNFKFGPQAIDKAKINAEVDKIRQTAKTVADPIKEKISERVKGKAEFDKLNAEITASLDQLEAFMKSIPGADGAVTGTNTGGSPAPAPVGKEAPKDAATPAPAPAPAPTGGDQKGPACGTVPEGTTCTSSGSLALGKAEDLLKQCDKFHKECLGKATNKGDCDNKLKDCQDRINVKKDLSPDGPKSIFGVTA